MKKISSGEISASDVSNGLSTRKTARTTTTTTTTAEEESPGADPYGLLEYNDEETLQELVSLPPLYFVIALMQRHGCVLAFLFPLLFINGTSSDTLSEACLNIMLLDQASLSKSKIPC